MSLLLHDTDLLFESIISYNNFTYSAGGAVNEGDDLINGIFKLSF